MKQPTIQQASIYWWELQIKNIIHKSASGTLRTRVEESKIGLTQATISEIVEFVEIMYNGRCMCTLA